MSAPDLLIPSPSLDYQVSLLARAAWAAGYRAGMEAGLAAAEAIVQRASDAEDNEGAPV